MLTSAAARLGYSERDTTRDLLYVGAFFVSFVVADVLTRRVADFGLADATGSSLVVDAVGANVLMFAALILVMGLLVWRSPERFLARWTDLERGAELRLLAIPLILFLTWQGSLYQYNYLLERAHLFDRGLVVVLGAAALARPMFLVPFVALTRIIAVQFTFSFGNLAAQNTDEMLVLVLVALAVAHLVFVATGRVDTAPVVLLIVAAVATHFFIPGRGKVLLNWLVHEDIGNMAANGYAMGWLGQTDGSISRWLAGVGDTLGVTARLGTLVLELGALVVAVNHRWFRWWLPFAIVFHIANFWFLGFWFAGWIIMELFLFILLRRRELGEWLDRNLTIGRAALTAVSVAVLGPLLFHPPGLAWLDSPVGYGYQIEVEGVSGATYNLENNGFAPFNQDLAFSRLQLGETNRLTGAYGAVVSVARLQELEALTDVSQVLELEEPVTETDRESRREATEFLERFLAYANDRATGGNRVADTLDPVGPLDKYWSGRPDPIYEFQEPIRRLEVVRVTGLRTGDRFQQTMTSVLTIDG